MKSLARVLSDWLRAGILRQARHRFFMRFPAVLPAPPRASGLPALGTTISTSLSCSAAHGYAREKRGS